MKRKLFAIFAIVMLILANSCYVFADQKDYVVDNADLLSDSEETQLEQSLSSKSRELGFDIVVVTEESTGDKSAEAYADDFYDYNGYGQGDDNDGCILLISMENRDWHISTTGYGITALTDRGIQYIADQFLESLSDGNYSNAFNIFADQVEIFVEQARTGEPFDSGNLPAKKKAFHPMFAVWGLVLGLLSALGVTGGMKAKMRPVGFASAAKEYLNKDSFKLTGRSDTFITASVTRQKKTDDEGGSSTHTGSSGTTHGGGGGHF